jgi:NADPH-dependent ferric siderophore reductase
MVEVAALQRLSPSFLRVTFTGEELNTFADNGFDQRIKVIVPLPGAGVTHLPTGADWHARWRELPEHERNPIRTYTVRHVRQSLSEVDIDFVMHEGGTGPAARWMESATVGDKMALLGPNARHDGEHGGIDFHAPAAGSAILLAGDETAVPAVAGILQRLSADAQGEAVLEVPHTEDFLPIGAPPGVAVTWLAREGQPHGSLLVPAVRASAARVLPRGSGEQVEDVDVDEQILWEVDNTSRVWVAGEAAMVRALRHLLVTEHGVDRRSAAFLGYWRAGRAEISG